MYKRAFGLILLFLVLVICYVIAETDKTLDCKECRVNEVKCAKYENQYYEWNCVEVGSSDGCGIWSHNYESCILPDIGILDSWVTRLVSQVGDNFTMFTAFESHNLKPNIHFDFSFLLRTKEGHVILSDTRASSESNLLSQKTDDGKNIWANTSLVLEQPGEYEYLVIADPENTIKENNEHNNRKIISIYVKPKLNRLDLENTSNYHKSQLKKIVYCNTQLKCSFFERVIMLFKDDEGVLDTLGYYKNILNSSKKEFQVFTATQFPVYFTICSINENSTDKLLENASKKSDEFFLLTAEGSRYEGRITKNFCNLYNVIYEDRESRELKPDPELPLMKINLEKIDRQLALNAVLYYITIVIEGTPLQAGRLLDGVAYNIKEAGSNFIVTIITSESLRYQQCGQTAIYYDTFKVNKKDRLLSRLNRGYAIKKLEECVVKPKKKIEEVEISYTQAYCENDNDCILVKKQCCSCDYFAVNKQHVVEISPNCFGKGCPTRACPIRGYPKCIDNQCNVVQAKYCTEDKECTYSERYYDCMGKEYCNSRGLNCSDTGAKTCTCVSNECSNGII